MAKCANSVYYLIFLATLGIFVSADNSDLNVDGLIASEEISQEYMADLNKKLASAKAASSDAEWDFNTNITDYTKNKMLDTQNRFFKFEKDVWLTTKRFNYTDFKNATLKRLFEKISVLGVAALPDDKLEEINSLETDMYTVYSTAKVCVKGNCNLDLTPDLEDIMSNAIDDPVSAKEAWKNWRDSSGKPIRKKYLRWAKLGDEAAKLNGFNDLSEMWLNDYETPSIRNDLQKLFEQLLPLYKQLHAYVRSKLRQKFPNDLPKDGTIPAHLLGNMWAQEWTSLFPFVRPYNKSQIDVTNKMKSLGWNVTKMFRVAEEFFSSLGLEPMPESFWTSSMLEKPKDGRQVVCHASAWDFSRSSDFRIKMCASVNMNDLVTIHHEMGHVEYYLLYKDQPIPFRLGANPGFHEAIGDLMSLSVSTPTHLKQIGLLDEADINDKEAEINFLLEAALRQIAFLPFGYIIDRWRWDIFNGATTEENLNRNWWKLRIEYQGVSPPFKRSEKDFDPGAKYHVPNAVPYIRYFISTIIRFQFHKALCQKAGYTGPLHYCDIYKSKEAGNVLRDALSMGYSKPWWEAMEVITGQRNMSAEPLLEYFSTLEQWLRKENEEEIVGWESAHVDDYVTASSNYLHSVSYMCLFVAFFITFY